MEAKIHSDIRNNKNQELNELKFSLETVKNKLDALGRDVSEYEKENKLLIKDLEENSKSFEKRDKNRKTKNGKNRTSRHTLIITVTQIKANCYGRTYPSLSKINMLKTFEQLATWDLLNSFFY